MTALAPERDLTALTDGELSRLHEYGTDAERAAVRAECERQDRARRARHAWQSGASGQAHAEWEAEAYAQYLRADGYAAGNLLSAAGQARGRDPWPWLWQGSEDTARRFASEELQRFWDWTEPRPPGPAAYAAQRREGLAAAEQEGGDMITAEEPVSTADQMAAIRQRAERAAAGLPGDAPVPVRPGAAGVVAVPEMAIPAGLSAGDQGAMERQPGQRKLIDGALLLTNVYKWLKRYLYLDSDAKYRALTVWIAGSHFRDESGVLVHETYPIAGFLSAEPGSGKTHALELLTILCPSAPSILVEPSEASVALLIEKHHRTILLDEGDILFGAGKRKAAIRAILNSGYKKGGTWPRVRKGDVEEAATFGAKAIAALSIVKTGTGSALDALISRIVEWEMSKPPAGTAVHKLREVFQVPGPGGTQVTHTGRSIGAHLRDQMAGWAAQERDALTGMIPEVPEGVSLREEEKWLPLLGVAARAEVNRQDREVAAGRTAPEDQIGDDWAALGWDACVDMSLYGGTPDVAGEAADAVSGILAGW